MAVVMQTQTESPPTLTSEASRMNARAVPQQPRAWLYTISLKQRHFRHWWRRKELKVIQRVNGFGRGRACWLWSLLTPSISRSLVFAVVMERVRLRVFPSAGVCNRTTMNAVLCLVTQNGTVSLPDLYASSMSHSYPPSYASLRLLITPGFCLHLCCVFSSRSKITTFLRHSFCLLFALPGSLSICLFLSLIVDH